VKEYDFIVIGSGSALEIVWTLVQEQPNLKVAVVDKRRQKCSPNYVDC